MSQSIFDIPEFDIPEHDRQFRSHPDTLRGKEEAVIKAAIAYFKSQHDWTERGVVVDFAQLYDDLWGATDALIAAREKQ